MILENYDFTKHTIQDPIHGAITFGPIERVIIDHPWFQRLHGLRQNSLLYLVFPSANHTRFEHSIGVMGLAEQYLEAIINNQKNICAAGTDRKSYQEPYRVDGHEISKIFELLANDHYYKLIVRIAALFHDIGHGPFSHLFENFFPTSDELLGLKQKAEYQHIQTYLMKDRSDHKREPIRHEVLSCFIATRILLDSTTILKEFDLNPLEMAKDVCAIIEKGVTPTDRLMIKEYNIHGLLHDIISSDLDADRMDYLLRDSHMCGVNYGLYDPDRILKSMCAYGQTDNKEIRVGVRYSALGAVEDFLFSRYQMYSQIYGHKTSRACNAMLDRIHEHLKEAKWNWYAECDSVEAFLTVFNTLDDASFKTLLRDNNMDEGSGKVKEIADNLFIERRLAKRVFEERADSKQLSMAMDNWKKKQKQLQNENIWFVEDKFENKGPEVNGANYYLKVLKKNSEGHYNVQEIKDCSKVLHSLPEKEYIFRIYCGEKDEKSAVKMIAE